MKVEENAIIQELKGWVEITHGRQKEFFLKALADAKTVKIESIHNVFDNNEVKDIIKKVKPKAKQCYKNASLFCKAFMYDQKHNVQYVEGRFTVFGGLSLDHAFNCVDGHYVDITAELALGKSAEEIKKETYVSLIECNGDELIKYELKSGVYGNVYSTKFLEG